MLSVFRSHIYMRNRAENAIKNLWNSWFRWCAAQMQNAGSPEGEPALFCETVERGSTTLVQGLVPEVLAAGAQQFRRRVIGLEVFHRQL